MEVEWKESFPRENIYFENEHGILYIGESQKIMPLIPSETISLIVTDPPYPKKYFDTYVTLSEEAPRLMVDGASLTMIVGHYALVDVIRLFENKLKYRWILCMDQESGKHARMAMGIEVVWKPILWYVKRAYPMGRGFIRDKISILKKDGIKKEYHKWQQSEQWSDFIISKLSNTGDIVLDPYMGSGTVAISAERLGRKWIGIEKDEKSCAAYLKRRKENYG